MPLQPGSRHGVYEILGAIGAGGMGEVYRARDTTLKRDVALKVLPDAFALDPERMARFQREAEVLASLNHPNIAAIYGLEESDGIRALVLELVEGPTLQERLEARGSGLEKTRALALDDALAIARQIADALEAAHERGIIHRDSKPANIKVRPDGSVKVLDFGLAKAFEPVAPVDLSLSPTITSPAATRMGVILGTAAYMSPEQARGQAVDKRADIWAFGVVLYEMLTGKRLFDGDTVSDTLASVLKETPEWDRVPAQALPLLRRCLEKDPKRRLRDIGDAMTLLDDAPMSTATAPAAHGASRFWPALATVLVVALAGLAVVHFRERLPTSPGATRFQIAGPEKVALAASGGFSVSPDGRKLVFAAAGSDNVTRLWVRALDLLEARPLAGTEIIGVVPPPFWSPDSRFVAFDAGGKLKKIDITGGPAQTVCDSPTTVVGGSWNRDGVIIFAPLFSGLMRVSAAGGVASPVTRLDQSRREVSHVLPFFLPDGRHFVYTRLANTSEGSGAYVGSLDTKPEEQSAKQLLPTTYGVIYAPVSDSVSASSDGHLLFRREGTLMAQPFDDQKFELSGEPAPMAEQLGSYLANGFFSASTNGVLIFRTGAARQNSQLTWFDRQGTVLGNAGEPGQNIDLALSPDGARVAVHRLDFQTRAQDLWLLDFASGTTARLTFGPSFAGSPVWSPDGSRIVFASNRGGSYDLYQKPANGAKDEEALLKSSGNKRPTNWSRDGRFLLYTEVDPTTKNDVWVLPLEGDRKPMPFLHSAFSEDQGQFSPDARFVAYVSDESGRAEVYVREFSANVAGGKWLVSKAGGSNPRWRGDGKELFYSSPDGTIIATDVVTAGGAFQAGSPKTSLKLPPGVTTWEVTADGARLLVAIPSEQSAQTPFTVVLNWQEGLKK